MSSSVLSAPSPTGSSCAGISSWRSGRTSGIDLRGISRRLSPGAWRDLRRRSPTKHRPDGLSRLWMLLASTAPRRSTHHAAVLVTAGRHVGGPRGPGKYSTIHGPLYLLALPLYQLLQIMRAGGWERGVWATNYLTRLPRVYMRRAAGFSNSPGVTF